MVVLRLGQPGQLGWHACMAVPSACADRDGTSWDGGRQCNEASDRVLSDHSARRWYLVAL